MAPSGHNMFTDTLNMLPAGHAMKAGRSLMSGKFFSQALPLRDSEAPLVQTKSAPGVFAFKLVAKFVVPSTRRHMAPCFPSLPTRS